MVDILSSFYVLADSFLIFLYRITGLPMVDYFMGTFFLAFLCVVVGEISISLALRFNQRYIDEMTTEMETKEKLSMEAYRSGDRQTIFHHGRLFRWNSMADTLYAGLDADAFCRRAICPGISAVPGFWKDGRLYICVYSSLYLLPDSFQIPPSLPPIL
jgi:hypothetical protein